METMKKPRLSGLGALTIAVPLCLSLALGCASGPLTAAPERQVQASPSAEPELNAIAWDEDAWSCFQAEVPKAVQKIAKKAMEKKARERGLKIIDMAFYQEMKKEQGR